MGELPVYFQERPFTARPRVFQVAQGRTIAEIVDAVPELPTWFRRDGIVCVNGQAVPRELWRRVRPRAGTEIVVTLHLPLAGSKVLTTVLAAAVLVAAVVVSAGALAPILGPTFAAGTIGAQLAAAGLAVGGSLLVAALAPPPSLGGPPAPSSASGAQQTAASL